MSDFIMALGGFSKTADGKFVQGNVDPSVLTPPKVAKPKGGKARVDTSYWCWNNDRKTFPGNKLGRTCFAFAFGTKNPTFGPHVMVRGDSEYSQDSIYWSGQSLWVRGTWTEAKEIALEIAAEQGFTGVIYTLP